MKQTKEERIVGITLLAVSEKISKKLQGKKGRQTIAQLINNGYGKNVGVTSEMVGEVFRSQMLNVLTEIDVELREL